jgi:phage gpG-like protein
MAFSLESFASLLIKATVLMPTVEAEAMEKAAAMLETEAKHVIGSNALASNAEATLAHKDGVNTPGVDTGETRDSITHNSDRHEAYIGSNDERLKWLEYGTGKVGSAWGGPNPPRPVLGITVLRKGDEAAEIVGQAIARAITIL